MNDKIKLIKHAETITVPEKTTGTLDGTEDAQVAAQTVPHGFGSRVTALVSRYGGTRAFARKVGVSEAVVRKWKSNISDPSREHVVAIADAYDVSLEWLAAGRGPMLATGKTGAPPSTPAGAWEEFDLVPLFEAVASAGAGAVVEGEQILAQLAFRKDWLARTGLRARQLALVCAAGDSMEPAINDGDVLLIDTAKRQPVGGHIYVLRISDELRAKRLQRLIDGSVRVSSDNKIYADEVIDASDLDQLHILGRVVWKGGLI